MLSNPSDASFQARTLQRVPVAVLTGQVDDHFLAVRAEISAERVGRQHGVPGRIVRDREHIYPVAFRPEQARWLKTRWPAKSLITPVALSPVTSSTARRNRSVSSSR